LLSTLFPHFYQSWALDRLVTMNALGGLELLALTKKYMQFVKKSPLVLAGALAVVIALFYAFSVFATSSGALVPSSDGNYTQWTPSTGTSHFALVDETPCNTTDFNSTTVVGNRDSYGVSLSSVPNGATITQIDIKPCASRVNAGAANPVMNVFYRANGVDSADAGSYSLLATTPADLATTTYNSLSITKGTATTLEIGAVLTSGTKGAKLSRIATVLTYTPLAAPSNLTLTQQPGTGTTTDIVLNWTDNATNEAGFQIERAVGTTTFSQIGTTATDTTTFTDFSHTSGSYTYRVRAYNAGGTSVYTNTASTTIP
jgi:hypothetical protein